MIFNYFDKVKTTIENYSHIIENYQLNERVYSEARGYIEGEITFTDDSRLDFAVVKDIEINLKIKYHYHYMDSENNLIFRYDNARHYKGIKSFPNHKHLPNTIEASSEPEITTVLSEIENRILKK